MFLKWLESHFFLLGYNPVNYTCPRVIVKDFFNISGPSKLKAYHIAKCIVKYKGNIIFLYFIESISFLIYFIVGDILIKIGIIGGTGVYDPSILINVRHVETKTPYGMVSYKVGDFAGKSIAFIPRHGSKHSIAPHLINYRANIWALKKIGVSTILATAAVGSLHLPMKLGDFVLVDQFIDFTKNRVTTFHDGGERGVVHVDLTNPYCTSLRDKLLVVAQNSGLAVHSQGTYVCTEGPRFETPAEIAMFSKLGGHLVGMTSVPEVVLAREAEMCYATIAMVTNFAAGISGVPLTYGEVMKIMKQNTENLKTLLMDTIKLIDIEADCSCQHALAEYGGFKI